jgi:uncharacterized protein
MKLQYLIYIALFIGVYGLLNFYIGLRGWQTVGSKFPRAWKKFYWIIYWVAAFAYVIGMAGRRYFPGKMGQVLDDIGSYWLAAFMYLLMIIVAADFVRIILKSVKLLPGNFSNTSNIPFYTGIFVLLVLAGTLVWGTWNANTFHIKHYDIGIPKKAGSITNLKVAMVSDIHLGKTVGEKRLSKMVDAINKLKPDIILIAGDILDNDLQPFIDQNMGRTLSRLEAPLGVYAALGNHDYFSGDLNEKVAAFEAAGINVLRDRSIKIADDFYVVGREDKSSTRVALGLRKDLRSLLGDLDKTLPVILIDHQPVNLSEPEKQGVDLQLSGHTHQGQLFPIDLITNKVFEVDYGYLRKNNMQVIVSSGYGTWGPPIRVGNSGEIVEVNVNFK